MQWKQKNLGCARISRRIENHVTKSVGKIIWRLFRISELGIFGEKNKLTEECQGILKIAFVEKSDFIIYFINLKN